MSPELKEKAGQTCRPVPARWPSYVTLAVTSCTSLSLPLAAKALVEKRFHCE